MKKDDFNEMKQKVIDCLKEGGSIVLSGPSGIRLRDKDVNPILIVHPLVFNSIKSSIIKKEGIFIYNNQ